MDYEYRIRENKGLFFVEVKKEITLKWFLGKKEKWLPVNKYGHPFIFRKSSRKWGWLYLVPFNSKEEAQAKIDAFIAGPIL